MVEDRLKCWRSNCLCYDVLLQSVRFGGGEGGRDGELMMQKIRQHEQQQPM